MSLTTVIKHYNELTTDELYRIIQLRIDGFIVRNKTCYQDMEAHYDKNSWWMMTYDTVLGLDPQLMVGVNSLCLNKTFTGKDGTEYKYPAWRRQAWLPAYKGGCSFYDLEVGTKFLEKMYGSPNSMCEILNLKGVKEVFKVFKMRQVNFYIDDAGRENYVMIYDEKSRAN